MAQTDTTAPTLSSATVYGQTVTLTYNEPLDQTSRPSANAFFYRLNGTNFTPDAVNVSGSTVTLTTQPDNTPIAGDVVQVSYTKPGTNPIQDVAGNDAANFTNEPVTNRTGAAVVWVAVAGDRLTLTYSLSLGTQLAPAAAYEVSVNGGPGQNPRTVRASGRVLTLELSSAVGVADAVTVSYTRPATSPLLDSSSNEPAGFSSLEALNNTALIVSNIQQVKTDTDRTMQTDLAQAFTTGSDAYRVTRVDLVMATQTTTQPSYTVSIRASGTSGQPGTSLGTLTPDLSGLPHGLPLVHPAVVEFNASGNGISLDAGTTYFVVIDVSTGGSNHLVVTANGAGEDAGAAAGWSIGNTHIGRPRTSTGNFGTFPGPVKIGLHGYRRDGKAPVLRRATASGTTLTLAFDEPLHGGPAPPVTAFEVSVDGGAGERPVAVAVQGSVVRLTLAEAVEPEQSVTLSYSPPASNALRDRAVIPNRLPGFSNLRVAVAALAVGQPQQPLQLALWTDRPAYRAGETVRLYRTLAPHDDRNRYVTSVYLERVGGGDRRYLAPLSDAAELHSDPVDYRGMPLDLAPARTLVAADTAMSWEGKVPGPGLWRFVLELRPGAADEQVEEFDEPLQTRRAWASFTIAERYQLLNRSGFDREVRGDLTLRSDTIYNLGHQLFVHDGATLAIEPGTVVRAWGRDAAIVVEPGGRIVAEGTREAPVVLTCSQPAGQREPGCWGGLRLLGRAPVTRREGVAPGVVPAERAVYGGTDAADSSGSLRYVRVEFAGAPGGAEAASPGIGLYGAGSGTVLDHVQAHASLGDGFAFRGGAATCGHCVASNSGNAGLSWERGWRGGATHLYIQHGSGGYDGLAGGNDEEGHDLEPRSLPTLSNVTLVHAWPYGRRERQAVALRLSTGSGVTARDLLATRFLAGAIEASGRSALLFGEGDSSVIGALLYLNGFRQLRGGIQDAVDFISRQPKLRDVRNFPNPDPRPKADSPALKHEGESYIGAFGRKDNWLDEWTAFGPESVYDPRVRDGAGN